MVKYLFSHLSCLVNLSRLVQFVILLYLMLQESHFCCICSILWAQIIFSHWTLPLKSFLYLACLLPHSSRNPCFYVSSSLYQFTFWSICCFYCLSFEVKSLWIAFCATKNWWFLVSILAINDWCIIASSISILVFNYPCTGHFFIACISNFCSSSHCIRNNLYHSHIKRRMVLFTPLS